MTIRHKANISHKINNFQVMLSKYSSQNQNVSIVQLPTKKKETPQYAQQSQRNLSGRMLDQKEVSIKSIDQRINNIMRKHQNGGDYTRSPLEPLKNQSNHKKEVSLHQVENEQKSPMLSTKKQGGIKVQNMKQEWKRLRQRSNKIFESTDRYHSNQPKQNSKYDQEIKKLNERIKQAEQKKKNLNIDFNPFVATSKSRPKLQNLSQRARPKPSIHVTPAKEQSKVINKQIISQFKIEVLTPKKLTSEKIGGIVKNKNTTPFSSILSSDMPKQINLSLPQTLIKPKQKKFIKEVVDEFINQMVLDQQLRNYKIWFTFSNEDNKWIKLQEKLNSKGFLMSSEVCRTKFQSTVQEHNPFYRWENIKFQQGLNSLVRSYDQSEKNWHVNILKKWNRQNLQLQNIKQVIIFQQRKEQFTIQDLVRFINTQTGKYYRNRDFHILFKRFGNKSNLYVQFEAFMTAISK